MTLALIAETESDCPVRVEVRFKNARLYDAISAHDLPSWSEGKSGQLRGGVNWFADFYDLNVQDIYGLLGLKRSPFVKSRLKNLVYRPMCYRLASLLERDVEWLFPVDLYATQWPTLAKNIRRSDSERLRASVSLALPPQQQDVLEVQDEKRLVNDVLETITPREEKIIRARFGIGGQDEKTLQEIASEERVGVERIRQIEAKALRKLRHPSRSRKLAALLPGSVEDALERAKHWHRLSQEIEEERKHREREREEYKKQQKQKRVATNVYANSTNQQWNKSLNWDEALKLALAQIRAYKENTRTQTCDDTKDSLQHLAHTNAQQRDGRIECVCGHWALTGPNDLPKCPECLAWLHAS